MTNVPVTPNTPVKDLNLSTKTSIVISWDEVADNAGESGGMVTGYRVYMAKDTDGSFVMVFDGKKLRTIVKHIAEDLGTGRFYRLKVCA